MKTIFINLPHKLLILLIFAMTYAPVLYFAVYSKFNNVIIGDAAKSLTFIWTVFLLTIINLIYRLILKFNNNNKKFTKFLIRTNAEYGKIYTGLFLTAFIFIVQAAVFHMADISLYWHEDKTLVYTASAIIILAFLIFPAVAAVVNYYLVKYFRTRLWGPKID